MIRAIPKLNGGLTARPVVTATERAKRRVLPRAGAFLRRRMRSSIRKRKGVAPPGSPPSSHRGDLRRLIVFGVDRDEGAVYVGPLLFRRRGSTTGAALLEFGGTAPAPGFGARLQRYAGHPFAGPALVAEVDADTFPELLKGSVY